MKELKKAFLKTVGDSQYGLDGVFAFVYGLVVFSIIELVYLFLSAFGIIDKHSDKWLDSILPKLLFAFYIIPIILFLAAIFIVCCIR